MCRLGSLFEQFAYRRIEADRHDARHLGDQAIPARWLERRVLTTQDATHLRAGAGSVPR